MNRDSTTIMDSKAGKILRLAKTKDELLYELYKQNTSSKYYNEAVVFLDLYDYTHEDKYDMYINMLEEDITLLLTKTNNKW